MSDDEDKDFKWILALEAALHDGCEFHEIINITRGRVLPEEHRAKIWYICLGGGNKINNFSQFDEIFDLPEQSTIRGYCKSLVDKLGNEEEDKIPIVCDTESIFTYYCKSRHLKFDPSRCWTDILTPLLAVKMPRDHIYACFEEILEKYIPRDTNRNAPVYHLLRLILLYHDPELTTFLDSKKITPDLFCGSWMRSLFSSVCALDAILSFWDIYLQERDPFFILFLVLVILVNTKEQIINMNEETSEQIVDFVSQIPSNLKAEDVPDFCSLARYYATKTPKTFIQEFATLIFGSVYMGHSETRNLVGNLPLSQALCLPVSAEEILETCQMTEEIPEGIEQVRFFLVDCRPSEQYNAGHPKNAFHVDSNLMLQQPTSFQTAVEGLFMVQDRAVKAGTPGCGKHLCFIGSGRDTEDQYLHMVVSSFLQKNTYYVSLAKGGYQAFHDLVSHDLDNCLQEHDSKKCIVCSPRDDAGSQDSPADRETLVITQSTYKDESILNKFSSISSVFKSKSAEMKGKIVDYITNPNGGGGSTPPHVGTGPQQQQPPLPGRHVNPNDKGKLYKSHRDVFSIRDEDDDFPNDAEEKEVDRRYEVVDIAQWQKKTDILHSFKCSQVRENGFTFPSYILLTEALMYVIREEEEEEDEEEGGVGGSKRRRRKGRMMGRRTLASIVKITSKKKHPDFITFKYGATLPDGDVSVSDMDRFIIPKASSVTGAIKQLIMNLIQKEKT